MEGQEDKLTKLLLGSLNGATGSYNHLAWSMKPGTGPANLSSLLVSLHENAHLILNNQTPYGGLIMAYADMNAVDTVNGNRYLGIMKLLVNRCRTAHEIFATWMSAKHFKPRMNEFTFKSLLANEGTYLTYYERGERIVSLIKGDTLRSHVFFSSLSWCFQSRTIAEKAIDHLYEFWFDEVNPLDFPDNRFEFLERLGPDFFSTMLLTFIKDKSTNSSSHYLQGLLESDNLFDVKMFEQDDAIQNELMSACFNALNNQSDYQNLPSFKVNEHLTFFKLLLDAVLSRYPKSQYRHYLFFDSEPQNKSRTTAMIQERQVIAITEERLEAMICPFDQMTADLIENLLHYFKSRPLLVMYRSSETLTDQYIFTNDSIVPEGDIVFSRFPYICQNKTVQILVSYSSSFELYNFVMAMPNDTVLIKVQFYNTMIGEPAGFDWKSIGSESEKHAYIINDVSIIYFVENLFRLSQPICFCKVSIAIAEITYSAFIFRYSENNNVDELMIVPASEHLLFIVSEYIIGQSPAQQEQLTLNESQIAEIEFILTSIFSQEHSWHFRPAKILNEFF